MSAASEFLLGARIFYLAKKRHVLYFQSNSFGFRRALYLQRQGEESRGSLRGLRAGPASFPRPPTAALIITYPSDLAGGGVFAPSRGKSQPVPFKHPTPHEPKLR